MNITFDRDMIAVSDNKWMRYIYLAVPPRRDKKYFGFSQKEYKATFRCFSLWFITIGWDFR